MQYETDSNGELVGLPSKRIVCVGCGTPFVWASGDQLYYRDRGFDPPKRCEKCRAKKKAEIEQRKKEGKGRF